MLEIKNKLKYYGIVRWIFLDKNTRFSPEYDDLLVLSGNQSIKTHSIDTF